MLLGILEQVRQHDVERGAIDARRQGRRHLRHRHTLALAPRLGHHLVGRLGEIAALVAARRQRVGTGKLEDAPHQAFQPLGVGQDVGQELAPLLGRHLVEMVAQQLGAAADAGERRLELVADAERQVADIVGAGFQRARHGDDRLRQRLRLARHRQRQRLDRMDLAARHAAGHRRELARRPHDGVAGEPGQRHHGGDQHEGELEQGEALAVERLDDVARRA